MIIIRVDFHPSFSRLLRWIPTPEFQEKRLAHGEARKIENGSPGCPSSWKATDYSRPVWTSSVM
jgi:hypothetical protein